MAWLGAGLLQEELDCLVEGEDGVGVGPHPGPRLVDGLGGQVHVNTRVVRHLSANMGPSATANEVNIHSIRRKNSKKYIRKCFLDIYILRIFNVVLKIMS